MNEKVFEWYEKIMDFLNEDEKTTFKLGFTLGISEGISQCTDKMRKIKK